MNNNIEIFSGKVSGQFNNKEIVKLVLSSPKVSSSEIAKVIITIVELKKGFCYNFVYRHKTKDITKNYDESEALKIIIDLIENQFNNAELKGVNENILLYSLPNGKIQLKTIKNQKLIQPSNTHNKIKEKFIQITDNIYLKELGVLNANFELRREMNDKYRQINRYIELLAPYLKDLNIKQELHIVDMGSGKGYLTFAVFDYLSNNLNVNTWMTGVELREDLINTCTSIAKKAGFDKLSFIKGSISEVELSKIDVLIALHACDTATDDAIFRGIKSKAELIVCAPCCHKQIRKAMNVNNELCNITKFGILKERQAEILTDTLRAMIMELNGYKTNIFEFVSSEHTPKNLMIVGKKTKTPVKYTEIKNSIGKLKTQFGIEKHYLEILLGL